jgi:hypothetical protein
MKAGTTANFCEDVFILLTGALLSALKMLGVGVFVSNDVFLFLFMTFLASLVLVFAGKPVVFKPARIQPQTQGVFSRKNLTHHNDPLLM